MENIVKKNIEKLKNYYNVKTYKDLAENIGISKASIDYWIRNKKVPEKYLYILDSEHEENKSLVDYSKTTKLEKQEDKTTLSELEKILAESIDRPIAIEKITKILNKINNEDLAKVLKNVISYNQSEEIKGKIG